MYGGRSSVGEWIKNKARLGFDNSFKLVVWSTRRCVVVSVLVSVITV